MAVPSRFLGGLNPPPPPPHRSAMPTFETLDTDLIVTIAALVCALICVLGLAFVARCAWLRRFVGRDSAGPPPPPPAANQGLKKKVLKSLPKSTFGESREHAARLSDCAICLAEFAAGEEIRVLPQCGHGFHVACIDTWLGCHSSCPSCRRILLDARCQRCGIFPAAACSAAGARPETSDNHGNLFLP